MEYPPPSMGTRVSVRISRDALSWLEETSRRTGKSKAAIVRSAIEAARNRSLPRRFLRLIGSVRGPRDLSQRAGFANRPAEKPR